MPPPPIFNAHVCESHEEMMRYVIETRNDVKHISRSMDCMSQKMDSQINSFENRASAFAKRVDELEKCKDEKVGEERLQGKFTAAIAFIVSLVVSLLAVVVPWISSH